MSLSVTVAAKSLVDLQIALLDVEERLPGIEAFAEKDIEIMLQAQAF